MSDELPTSVWSGSFHIFGVEVKCHRLSDGQAIIEAERMAELLEAMSSPVTIDNDTGDELTDFLRWQRGQTP